MVARVQGIAMGGGMSFSALATVCEAGEKALFGMPETKVGFYVDIGAGYFLQAHTPQPIAMYLALTGELINAKQATQLGFIRPSLSQERKFDENAPPFLTPEMYHAFSQPTLNCLFTALHNISSGPSKTQAQKCLQELQLKSPTSLAVTFEVMKRSQGRPLKEVMEQNFITSTNFSMHPDFIEGIRAVLIEKDNNPRWAPPPIESELASFFIPKGKCGLLDYSPQEWVEIYDRLNQPTSSTVTSKL